VSQLHISRLALFADFSSWRPRFSVSLCERILLMTDIGRTDAIAAVPASEVSNNDTCSVIFRYLPDKLHGRQFCWHADVGIAS
jgi:hypothetical protein